MNTLAELFKLELRRRAIARTAGGPPLRCTYCGSNDHPTSCCPKTFAGSRGCGYCGSHEHDIEHCPKTFNGSARRRLRPDVRFQEQEPTR